MARLNLLDKTGGFTLTELMVTVAVGGMLVLGSAEVIKTFSGGQRGAMQAFEFDSLTSEIFQYLSKPAQCTAALEEAAAQNPKFCQTPPTAVRIKRAGGTAFYVGLPQDNAPKVEGMTLSAAITECKADPKRANVSVASLELKSTPVRGQALKRQLSVAIAHNKDDPSKMDWCSTGAPSATSSDPESFYVQKLGGTWNAGATPACAVAAGASGAEPFGDWTLLGDVTPSGQPAVGAGLYFKQWYPATRFSVPVQLDPYQCQIRLRVNWTTAGFTQDQDTLQALSYLVRAETGAIEKSMLLRFQDPGYTGTANDNGSAKPRYWIYELTDIATARATYLSTIYKVRMQTNIFDPGYGGDSNAPPPHILEYRCKTSVASAATTTNECDGSFKPYFRPSDHSEIENFNHFASFIACESCIWGGTHNQDDDRCCDTFGHRNMLSDAEKSCCRWVGGGRTGPAHCDGHP